MSMADFAAILTMITLFIAALACIIAAFMRFMHREFGWNPLSRRRDK